MTASRMRSPGTVEFHLDERAFPQHRWLRWIPAFARMTRPSRMCTPGTVEFHLDDRALLLPRWPRWIPAFARMTRPSQKPFPTGPSVLPRS